MPSFCLNITPNCCGPGSQPVLVERNCLWFFPSLLFPIFSSTYWAPSTKWRLIALWRHCSNWCLKGDLVWHWNWRKIVINCCKCTWKPSGFGAAGDGDVQNLQTSRFRCLILRMLVEEGINIHCIKAFYILWNSGLYPLIFPRQLDEFSLFNSLLLFLKPTLIQPFWLW